MCIFRNLVSQQRLQRLLPQAELMAITPPQEQPFDLAQLGIPGNMLHTPQDVEIIVKVLEPSFPPEKLQLVIECLAKNLLNEFSIQEQLVSLLLEVNLSKSFLLFFFF
jgi:hypothetical protein